MHIQISTKKFYLYLAVVIFCILIGFYSGFRLGRTVEKQEWLELVNKPECECLRI